MLCKQSSRAASCARAKDGALDFFDGLGVWHECAQTRLTCHSDAYQIGGREKSRASLLAYDLRTFDSCIEAAHNLY
jgi:hypothetical protein